MFAIASLNFIALYLMSAVIKGGIGRNKKKKKIKKRRRNHQHEYHKKKECIIPIEVHLQFSHLANERFMSCNQCRAHHAISQKKEKRKKHKNLCTSFIYRGRGQVY